MPRYSHWTEFETQEEFDQIMEKEYQERLNRYEEYVQKYQPTDVVKQYINDMLKADYYKENGAYKYTYGESEDYNEILRLKKQIAGDFKDAFIIAFLNGEKISTREAILIFKKQSK